MNERAQFEERGWIVLRGVVPREKISAIERAFDLVMDPWLAKAAPSQGATAGALWQLPGGCRGHPVLLSHLSGGVGARVGELLGADGIRLLQDTLIVKPAEIGGPIDLHQDYTYTGFLDPPRTVSVRLSLTDSTVNGGCMYVVDRSHSWGLSGSHSVFAQQLRAGVLEELPSELRERVEADRVPLELGPGDVSVHHCLTFHGSFENRSSTTRKTVVTHVYDEACTVIRDRLPPGAEQYIAPDAQGRLVGEGFPVLFRRSRPHDG